MPFLDHLEELRWVLFKMIAAVVVGTAVGWCVYRPAFRLLMLPLRGELAQQVELITATPLDAFLMQLKTSLLIGIVATLPLLFWLVWSFVSPGLNVSERHLGLWTVTAGTVFFLAGASFAFFLLRFLLAFLLRFTPDGVRPMWHIRQYMDFAFRILIAFGVLFELPVVIVLLVSLGLVQTRTLRKARPYAVVAAFLVSAILTPPDIFSQIILAVPLIVLYELGLLAGRLQERRLKRQASRLSG